MEDMCLDRSALSAEGRTRAYIHHAPLHFHPLFQPYLDGIDTGGRNHLTQMGDVYVGSREA